MTPANIPHFALGPLGLLVWPWALLLGSFGLRARHLRISALHERRNSGLSYIEDKPSSKSMDYSGAFRCSEYFPSLGTLMPFPVDGAKKQRRQREVADRQPELPMHRRTCSSAPELPWQRHQRIRARTCPACISSSRDTVVYCRASSMSWQ